MDTKPTSPWSLEQKEEDKRIDIPTLSEEVGISQEKIKKALQFLGRPQPERRTVPTPQPNGSTRMMSVLSCSIEDAEKVRRYFAPEKENDQEKQVLKEGYLTISRVGIETGLTTEEISYFLYKSQIGEMPIIPSEETGRPSFFPTEEIASVRTVHGETYLSPSLIAKIKELLKTTLSPPERWKYFNLEGVMGKVKGGNFQPHATIDIDQKVREEIDALLKMHPELSEEVIVRSPQLGEDPQTYYSIGFTSILRARIILGKKFLDLAKEEPGGYVSQSECSNHLEIYPSTLQKIVGETLQEHPGLSNPVVAVYDSNSFQGPLFFYSPELLEFITEKSEEYTKEKTSFHGHSRSHSPGHGKQGFYLDYEIPEGYIPRTEVLRTLKLSSAQLDNFANECLDLYPDMVEPTFSAFKKSTSTRPLLFYSPEFVYRIEERKAEEDLLKAKKEGDGLGDGTNSIYSLETGDNPPEGYISRALCILNLQIPQRKILSLERHCLTLHPNLLRPIVMIKRKGRSHDNVTFYSPKFVEALEKTHQDEEGERQRRLEQVRLVEEEQARLKKEVSDYLHQVEHGSLETEMFRRLVSLFGGARIIDLLYAFHPQFEKLPVEYIKGEMAKYLGDYLVVRSGNVLDDLEISLPYLGEKVFQESLYTVLKENIISTYGKSKRQHKDRTDRELLDGYLSELQTKVDSFRNVDFQSVVTNIEEYLYSLLNDFPKPDHIVEELEPGRSFPDLNQIINIKEIKDQRRVLIGDEMGMGKSGSAIFSKEYLKMGITLIIVPANVTDTWRRYLSDEVDPNGKPVGYFKKGQAPRVLEVQSLEDLKGISGDIYDYVLISHDRCTDEYADSLRPTPFEMIIIDEAHKFKNIAQGKRSKVLLELIGKHKQRDGFTTLLSGTPIPNKVKDIAILLKILYPEDFGEMDNSLLVSSIIKGDLINLRDLIFKRMQMKKLSESIDMPQKEEFNSYLELSKVEQELYDILLENDELTATEKMAALRLFCLNPQKVFPDQKIRGTKIEQTQNELKELFETKNKVVLFVNGYIEGVIRGENSALLQMKFPADVTIRVIDGETSREERKAIEKDLKYMTTGKMLLVVNGGAADVGVDFSAAEAVRYYNEPWTKFDKMQQTARVYRPGLKHDITVGTSIVQGTIEEGMHYYIEMKYKAVMKLLEGIPLSEIEKSFLLFDERVLSDRSLEGDAGLAEEWLRSPVNRLNKFFGVTKEIGEEKFVQNFLEKFGEEYAEYYAEIGSRGFQANTSRFAAALIEKYKKEKGLPDDITILDLGSGPEMLRKRMKKEAVANVYSLDINENHFREQNGRQVVAGFTKIPFFDSSIDYVNFSLAYHYSAFDPRNGQYERLRVLGEIARVLKLGGRAAITLPYSQTFKNRNFFNGLCEEMGLAVVDKNSGQVSFGNHYQSECITFEKVDDIDIEASIEEIKSNRPELMYGLRLNTDEKVKLKRSQDILKRFALNGETIETDLNDEDKILLVEQEYIHNEGKLLIEQYGSLSKIPKEEVLKRGFLRWRSGKKEQLIKKGLYSKSFIYVPVQQRRRILR